MSGPPPGRRSVASHWRHVLLREVGTPKITPPADCQVALVYPNTYAVGMSSLGYQMVYRWINEHPGALAERFFCEGRPALSVENQRPLGQFDCVAFSIAYELDYLNVVRFLLENHIPVRAAERDPKAEPLVVAGGICTLVNRLPIYDLADIFVIGDGEETVARLLAEWAESGGDRIRFIQSVAAIEGVEVTEGAFRRFGLDNSAHSAICNPQSAIGNPHFVPSLDSPDALSTVVTPNTELGARCLVEIARGCPYRCRFCFTGNCLPYRARRFAVVREMLEKGRQLTSRFGLIAPAVGSHPDIDQICEWCLRQGLDVSFSSLRLEDVRPAMIALLAAGGQQSVTIAPEAGSERLRRQLGKNLADERVVAFAADVVSRGLTDLRMYFMVGLPGEQEEDIEAIGRLVEATHHAAVDSKPRPQTHVSIAVNVSVFVPKPGTPFATQETPPGSRIKNRLRRLNGVFGKMSGVAFRMPSVAEAEVQRLLAWGDRDLLNALIESGRRDASWRAFLALTTKDRKEH